jgi:hypothetical protein
MRSLDVPWHDQLGSRTGALYGELPSDDTRQLLLVDGVPWEVHSPRMMGVSAQGTRTRVPPEGPRPLDETGPQTAQAVWGPVVLLQKREEMHARAIRTDWERNIGDSCPRSPTICTSFLVWQYRLQVIWGTISSIRQASVIASSTTTNSTRTPQHCFL